MKRVMLLVLLVVYAITLKSQDPISVTETPFNFRLTPGEQLLALEDSSAVLTIEQIQELTSLFDSYRKGDPTGVYWLRFVIHNRTEEDIRLVFSHRRMSYFDLYRFENDALVEHSESGRLKHQRKLSPGNGELYAGLTIRSGIESVIYARMQNKVDYGISPVMTIKDGISHFESSQDCALWNYTFIGGLIVLVIFTLTQLLIYRNWTYGWLFAHGCKKEARLRIYAAC